MPLAWKLHNTVGVKVWLHRHTIDGRWVFSIGDFHEDIIGKQFSESTAKRIVVGKLIAYLTDLAKRLESFKRFC